MSEINMRVNKNDLEDEISKQQIEGWEIKEKTENKVIMFKPKEQNKLIHIFVFLFMVLISGSLLKMWLSISGLIFGFILYLITLLIPNFLLSYYWTCINTHVLTINVDRNI